MPTATKTFLLRAVAAFAAILLVNAMSSNFGFRGGLEALMFHAVRYGLLGVGVFFLIVAGSAWGVALGHNETSRDALQR